MTDVMLDLETMGLRPGSVILSLGAVTFKRGEGLGEQFYKRLQIPPQVAVGAKIDEGTQKWWSEQSLAAWENATKDAQDPVEVLNEFALWYHGQNGKTIWANGAAYDPPLLAELYSLFGIRTPWHYRAPRDTRTLFDLCGKKIGDFGTVNALDHDALQDALWQASETLQALAELDKRK